MTTNTDLLNAKKQNGNLVIAHVASPKNRVTIRNDFTNRETYVDKLRPMTRERALRIRRRLCSDDCTSGDTLGARGPQEDGFLALRERADHAILTGETT